MDILSHIASMILFNSFSESLIGRRIGEKGNLGQVFRVGGRRDKDLEELNPGQLSEPRQENFPLKSIVKSIARGYHPPAFKLFFGFH